MIRVNILGSTGSIGRNALDVVAAHSHEFRVGAITGRTNVQLLAEQAVKFGAAMAVTADPEKFLDLRAALAGTGVQAAAGESAMIEAASLPADVTVAGILGFDGLQPTMAAMKNSKKLAFASKECLVCAGTIFLQTARQSGCQIIPTDSEHNAIFQMLDGRHDLDGLSSITLTASGGPFWNCPESDMRDITPQMAMAHPVWKMGQKISIDSATMMNKSLELIEAHYLFGLPESQIDVVLHPESLVHSLISFVDGAVFAHMGKADMRLPLAHAMFYPMRKKLPASRMDLRQIGHLRFLPLDNKRFPTVDLARHCMRLMGAMPLALNAANEIAVARFMAGEIGFMSIFTLLQDVLESAGKKFAGDPAKILPDMAAMLAVDAEIRQMAKNWAPRSMAHLAVAG